MRTVELLTLFARPASLWFCIVEAAPSREGLGFTRRPPTARPAAARCAWAAPLSHRRRLGPLHKTGRAAQAAPGQALWRRVKSEVNILEVFPGWVWLFFLLPRTSLLIGEGGRRMLS